MKAPWAIVDTNVVVSRQALPEGFVDFVRTPAPAWENEENEKSVPTPFGGDRRSAGPASSQW